MNRVKYKYLMRVNKKKYAPTKENIETINSTDWETLADWEQELNSWGWPKELYPIVEGKEYQPNQRRGQLMQLIKDKVGEKYILYKWNVYQRTDPDKMSEEEFEMWWENRLGYK